MPYQTQPINNFLPNEFAEEQNLVDVFCTFSPSVPRDIYDRFPKCLACHLVLNFNILQYEALRFCCFEHDDTSTSTLLFAFQKNMNIDAFIIRQPLTVHRRFPLLVSKVATTSPFAPF